MNEPITKTTQVTVFEAYMAMFNYPEHLQRLTQSDDLAGFLGGMSLLEDDQVTADPAAWTDWIRSVAAVRDLPPDISLRVHRK